jgi:predicted secreted acid phosphatase
LFFRKPKPTAVVFDIDKTLLKSQFFFKPSGGFDHPRFAKWAQETDTPGIASTVAALHNARRQGHEIHLITARPETLRRSTYRQLSKAGIPFHGMYFAKGTEAPSGPASVLYKSSTRAEIAKTRSIIASYGDSPTDFLGKHTGTKWQVVNESSIVRYQQSVSRTKTIMKLGGTKSGAGKVLGAIARLGKSL